MSFGFIAFHYPAPQHLDEFVAGCNKVADAARRQSGFESVGVWVTTDGGAVVTTGAFESEEAFQAAAALAGEMDAAPDGISDLEVKPREVHLVRSP
ncbi:antibiotic biosynthesis monooxygenase [Phytoactinopolyspora limicola]|uniref:antibiotic biosynthesis monooxygenase n=1 Tax=Phytoactinopolyspora limicola TaxID=2715536 RepID=UPI00140E33CB|nr:antibiotic biosynthesis monooxygenase [Phytoactinopolyspora limicola]